MGTYYAISQDASPNTHRLIPDTLCMSACSASTRLAPLDTGSSPAPFTLSSKAQTGLSAAIASGSQAVQSRATPRKLLETADVTPTPGTAPQVRHALIWRPLYGSCCLTRKVCLKDTIEDTIGVVRSGCVLHCPWSCFLMQCLSDDNRYIFPQ